MRLNYILNKDGDKSIKGRGKEERGRGIKVPLTNMNSLIDLMI